MSTLSIDRLPPEVRQHPPLVTKMDASRGTFAMWLFIATEAFLFLMFFFSYFYLARGGFNWPLEVPPKLPLAFVMLAVLLSSSAVLQWGDKQIEAQNYGRGRGALLCTILMGLGFLVIQFFEYRDHLKTLTPQTDVYGSVFYTITSFHAAHVVFGLSMLVYVLILPRLGPTNRSPHRPYHNASLYWHFVDFVWVWIVIFLYLTPRMR